MHVLYLFCILLCASATTAATLHYPLDQAVKYFEEFIIRFGKKYQNQQEFEHRLEIFKHNLEKVNHLNNESGSPDFGITKFADLTQEEFTRRHTGLRSYGDDADLCEILTDKDILDVNAPDSFDWRKKKAVTPVKDQRKCGSGYAFSACGLLESQYAIKHNQLLQLSEQEIINCDRISDVCCGGMVSLALKSLIQVGGLMKESDIPYIERRMHCQVDPSKFVLKVASCNSYNLTSQEKVKQLLYKYGPIAIGIRSLYPQLLYKGSIIKDEQCKGRVDDAALLVGYGTENNMPYWIVKSSWGTDFGESGYFRMQRSNNPDGACGMMNEFMTTAFIE